MFYAVCASSETMFTSRSGSGIQQLMQPLASDHRRGYLNVGLLLHVGPLTPT
jgi:hypothetical protein